VQGGFGTSRQVNKKIKFDSRKNKFVSTFCNDEINGNVHFCKAVVGCTEILAGYGADNFQFRVVGRHLEVRSLL